MKTTTKPVKKLSLAKETIRRLSDDSLRQVVGGASSGPETSHRCTATCAL